MATANQVVIITGASSGIGEALAYEMAQQGAKVGLIARREEKLKAIATVITEKGGVAAYRSADVSDREAVKEAIGQLMAELGPVDLLVANAGIGFPVTLEPFNVEEMERLIQVNYLGVLYAIEAVLPHMLERGSGHLAAVSSLASYKGMPGEQGYSASKAAVSNFLEGLRLHVRNRGIAVTTICPGFVRTPMTDHFESLPFAWSSEKAARRIAGALRRKKKVYNFPWPTTLLIKLGKWLPDWFVSWLVMKYTAKKNKS